MTDFRFFKAGSPLTLGQLAEIAGAQIVKGKPEDGPFTDVAPLEKATSSDVAAFYDKALKFAPEDIKAGVCITTEDKASLFGGDIKVLVAKEPRNALALIIRAFYPRQKPEPFISDRAYVAPTAKIGNGVRIEFGAYIGENAEIGDYCRIEPNAVIGDGVILGSECIVGANASVSHTIAGNNVVFYPGARVGQDGFGFIMNPAGHTKIPQVGRVFIGDNVEIGANTCIDRGAMDDTEIGSGTIIDNLVQIGHNNKLGQKCVIVSQVGIAGSCVFDDLVVAAGQAGFADHLHIGMGVQIAAQSGIMSDIAPGEKVMGSPAQPVKDYLRGVATLRKLSSKKG